MICLLLSALLALPDAGVTARGVPTTIVVRAISRDAKVIGDGVGGARITIRDLATGKVLASGIQRGGTGDTKRIMQEPRLRGAVVYGTESAAAFRTTLDLTGPTRVEITAEGPLKYPQAVQRASRTMLLVPGENIEGEGVLLEISGFIVDVAAPEAAVVGQPITLRTKVTLTCGCPTEAGGLWNADDIAVVARATRAGSVEGQANLGYAGETSTYEGTLPPLDAGTYLLEVIASNPKSSNFGRAALRLVVQRPGERSRGAESNHQ